VFHGLQTVRQSNKDRNSTMHQGRSLEAAGLSTELKIWEMVESVWHNTAILDDSHSKTVRIICWSPDGTFLEAAGFDSSVSIWECLSSREWQNVRRSALYRGKERPR